MQNKNNKKGFGIKKVGKVMTFSNDKVIKIDKHGENFVVRSRYVKDGSFIVTSPNAGCVINRHSGVIEFAANDTLIGSQVGEWIRQNHKNGGIVDITPKALKFVRGDGDGVWPPFVPVDAKIYVNGKLLDNNKK